MHTSYLKMEDEKLRRNKFASTRIFLHWPYRLSSIIVEHMVIYKFKPGPKEIQGIRLVLENTQSTSTWSVLRVRYLDYNTIDCRRLHNFIQENKRMEHVYIFRGPLWYHMWLRNKYLYLCRCWETSEIDLITWIHASTKFCADLYWTVMHVEGVIVNTKLAMYSIWSEKCVGRRLLVRYKLFA